jgi:LL-diaminopimelate aminotransferase
VKSSQRIQRLPLIHSRISRRGRGLLAAGIDVIDLGAGDADLAPPPAAVEALAKAARDPALRRYGFGLGYVPYRESISRWMERRFAQRFDPLSEIVPLIGSKEGIAHLAFGFLQPGDVAIVPEPGYMAYAGGTLLSDAQVHAYALRPRTNFLVDLDDIPRAVMDRTRILFLNYPNNPTAAIAPRST